MSTRPDWVTVILYIPKNGIEEWQPLVFIIGRCFSQIPTLFAILVGTMSLCFFSERLKLCTQKLMVSIFFFFSFFFQRHAIIPWLSTKKSTLCVHNVERWSFRLYKTFWHHLSICLQICSAASRKPTTETFADLGNPKVTIA